MPVMPLVPGARSFLLNGLMESDLDANGHKIWNLDGSNLNLGGGPNPFPAVAHEWLNSYDPVSRNFTALQPATTDLIDFPVQTGHANQFLMTDGSHLSFATPQSGGGGPTGFTGFINVKQAPFNAKGDGVTNDAPAIQAAINASTGGLTVYFPFGTYLLNGPLNVPNGTTLLGDSPFVSVLKLNTGVNGGILLCNGGSIQITRLGFDGNMRNMLQGGPTTVIGIGCNAGNQISIFQCLVVNCKSHGIAAQNCFGLVIRDTYVLSCGGYGIEIFNSPQSLLFGNIIQNNTLSGIWLVNSPQCNVSNNQVYSCGVFGYGIGLSDSDNTEVIGNKVQQCAVGLLASISPTRAITRTTNSSYGYVITGNNILRNYYGGILLLTAHGFNIAGNIITENGNGGADNVTYSIEPGIVIDLSVPANQGSGYQPGDILTVVGGSGTPAKAVVLRVNSSGAITNDGLGIISMGSYTILPTSNPLATTCGRSGPTGAKVILTTYLIQTGGSGYVVGQILRGNNGAFYNPVRLQVTAVGSGGNVTAFNILDGGGYFAPIPGTLTFSSDVLSAENLPSSGGTGTGSGSMPGELPEVSSGLVLVPLWGLRYSQNGKFGGGLPFGIGTLGAGWWGIISSNQINWVRTGAGILIADMTDTSHGNYRGRGDYFNVCGNTFVDNHVLYQGATDNVPDSTFNPLHSQFANNLVYNPSGL